MSVQTPHQIAVDNGPPHSFAASLAKPSDVAPSEAAAGYGTPRHWVRRPGPLIALLLLLLAALAATMLAFTRPPEKAGGEAPRTATRKALPIPPPKVEPLILRALPPEQAVALNAAIPLASSPGPAAKPLSIVSSGPAFANALDCLTAAIYYEAATQSVEGQRAVAQVVLNRVRHPVYPSSVCSVVFQGSERATGCQFTFTCDGSLLRRPLPSLWARIRGLAKAALSGSVYAPVGNATHYHANYVVPYWASSLSKSAVVGDHIFYRWKGQWGTPGAFRQKYTPSEQAFGQLIAGARREPVLVPAPEDALTTLELTSETPLAPDGGAPGEQVAEDSLQRPRLLADEAAGQLLVGRSGDEAASASRGPVRGADRATARACAKAGALQAKPVGPSNGQIDAGAGKATNC